MSGLGLENPGFSSNKSTHYLLDHGDRKIFIRFINDSSNSNHSLKFTILAVRHLKRKKNET